MDGPARAYLDLLDYQRGESRRWHAWLSIRPEARRARLGEGRLSTVRDVAAHVAIADLRYVQRLLGQPASGHEALLDAGWDEIGIMADRAGRLLQDWLMHATPAMLEMELTFQTLSAGAATATARTVALHVLTHGARHWAQVATCLRQQGFRQDWRHDYLFNATR